MWIHSIGEIMIGLFFLLILAHFGLHFWMKAQKKKQTRAQSSDSEN